MPSSPPTPSARWDPWAALRQRTEVSFHLDPVAAVLGGGFYARQGTLRAIVLDPSLSRRRRRTALAHELIHDERGQLEPLHGRTPPGLEVLVAREEEAVEREVARRLVPAAELLALLEARASVGEACEPWQVAEEFDVDDTTAARALVSLATRP